ncbi:ABC transporter permease [Streptomyces calidiresistens]|uniref:Transport permease protein n=1 Tax=Streptomyces calidiresistens TaxID=1485586 RepID=A0A7W3XWP3_9ACTN|nr:ABC transporter permease [Streptomyces calidiresistens]MBB0230285.1 ABC transporter permease [Streptomyces calidiresistens]
MTDTTAAAVPGAGRFGTRASPGSRSGPPPEGPGGHLPALLVDSWVLTHRAILHQVARPGPLLFSLAFNVLIILIFVHLLGGAMVVPGGGGYRDFLMPGMFVMAMLFGVGTTTQAVATDRERGVTDRFRSLPMSPAAVLIARAVTDMLLAVATLGVILLAALVIGWRHHGTVGGFVAAIGLVLLLRFALVWVGVYLGLTLSREGAVNGVQTLEFPVGFLSSAFVATATMPGWLGTLADWNPISSTVDACRELFGSPGVASGSWVTDHSPVMAVVWPVVLVLVFFPLSVHAFRGLNR